MIILRAGALLVLLACIIVVGAPLQWLFRRCGFETAAAHLQMISAQLLCRALGLHVVVHGTLSTARPMLVVANHISWTDILALASIAPLVFLSKSEVLTWPLIGRAVKAHGTLFVSRRRTKDFVVANQRIATALSRGKAVVLFAEGTTGCGTTLKPFHSGHIAAAEVLLANATHIERVSLVPATIAYTGSGGLPTGLAERISLAWTGDVPLMPHLAMVLRRAPIRCEIVWGQPLPFGRGEARRDAAVTLRQEVRRTLSRLITGRSPD